MVDAERFCCDEARDGGGREGYINIYKLFFFFFLFFEQRDPVGTGWEERREQAVGFNSRCQPQPTTADRKEGQWRCWCQDEFWTPEWVSGGNL